MATAVGIEGGGGGGGGAAGGGTTIGTGLGGSGVGKVVLPPMNIFP